MTLKLSPQIKIVAAVGILGMLLLGGGFTLLGKGTTAPPKAIAPLHGHLGVKAAAHTVAAPAKAKATTATAKTKAATAKAKAHAAARPAPHKVVKHKPVVRVKANAALDPISGFPSNGLPVVLNQALALHEVVVVSLYDPQSTVDAASLGEAMAGAKLAGAGFVPLNVLSQAQTVSLAKKLGVLPDPTLLVFRRPDTLAIRIDGFADRDTVAQAAANARP
jgi:hypothetical protein